MKRVKQLMIIDDDKLSLHLTEMAVRELGIAGKIVSCCSAFKALRYLTENCMPTIDNERIYCPELILLDINMPVIDGYEFLAELHRMEGLRHENTCILLVSNSPYRDEKEKVKYFPVVGYVEKPVTSTKMRAVLKNKLQIR
jgi:CheY-like chemotaxis protein